MRDKVIVLIALVLVLTTVVFIRTAPQGRHEQLSQQQVAELEKKERNGNIDFKERVQLAKARGKQQLVVPSLSTLYLGLATSPKGLDQKLLSYTVVIAQLVEKQSYMPDEAVIRTWNKLKVIDTLSQAPPRPTYFSWPAIPEELLSVKEDEILVHTQGGTVTIDGVEVSENDADVPAFRNDHKYLLVLSFEPSTKIGWLELGPEGLLAINPDNTLDASKDGYMLQQVLKRHHGGSINKLKEKLENRSGSLYRAR